MLLFMACCFLGLFVFGIIMVIDSKVISMLGGAWF